MESAVYIPSRQRAQLLKQSLPEIVRCGLPIYVAVEKEDVGAYSALLNELSLWSTELVILPESNRGVTYARQFVLEQAARRGHAYFATIDDDHSCSKLGLLIDALKYTVPNAGGVAAYMGFYKHFLKLDPDQGVVELTRGFGMNAYALNTEYCLKVGGYDLRLPRRQDNDIRMQLYLAGHPWYIHTGVPLIQRGQCYTTNGGIQSLPQTMDEMEKKAYSILAEKYGKKFIHWKPNAPKTKISIQFKRFCEAHPQERR